MSGVERIAKAVTQQVEGQRGQDERQTGEDQEPPGDGEQVAVLGLGDHVPPRRRRRLHAEAQEAQRGLEHDVHRDEQSGVNDGQREQIGQDLDEHDAQVARPEGTGCFDELAFAQADDLAAHQSSDKRPAEHGDHDDDELKARPEAGDDGQGEQKDRKGQQDVHEAGQHRVAPSAVVAGHQSHHHADDERDQRGADSHHQRDPSAVDDARQHVTPLVVGAEQKAVVPGPHRDAGERQPGIGVLVVRPVADERGQQRGEDGHEDEKHDEAQRDHGDPVMAEPGPGQLPRRAPDDVRLVRRALFADDFVVVGLFDLLDPCVCSEQAHGPVASAGAAVGATSAGVSLDAMASISPASTGK